MKTFNYSMDFMLSLFEKSGLELSKPLIKMLAALTVCLLGGAKANLVSLAEALPYDGTNLLVRMQRIRRFLSNEGISPLKTLILLIRLLRPILSELDEIVLTMDRTEWKKRGKVVNILTVALSYKGRAIPLLWIVLSRKGNTSFEHWKRVLAPVIEALKQMDWISAPIHVVADREFASPKLAEWLKTSYEVDSTLRLKASMYLSGNGMPERKIAEIVKGMSKGTRMVIYNQRVTRDSTFEMNVLLTWGTAYDEPLVVMTTLNDIDTSRADTLYGLRFGIEPMHKDWKSNAFDIEKSRITDSKRIETMLIPIAFAYVLCVFEGEREEKEVEVQKPPKGKNRLVGLFLTGLRAFCRHIRQATIEQLKMFILRMIKPFYDAWGWKIPAPGYG